MKYTKNQLLALFFGIILESNVISKSDLRNISISIGDDSVSLIQQFLESNVLNKSDFRNLLVLFQIYLHYLCFLTSYQIIL